MSWSASQNECPPRTNLSVIGSLLNEKTPRRHKISFACKETQSLDGLPLCERSGGDVPERRRLRCYQNPLEKWRENMAERQSLGKKIMRSTGKSWCDLLFNRSTEERDKLMVQRMLQHADDVHPMSERVEPKHIRLHHRVPGGECVESLVETLPARKQNRCNKHDRAIEISGLPSVSRAEIYGSCCCCNHSPWIKSQVLQQRMRQRRREIRHIVGHFPEIDALQVVGAQKPITPVLVDPEGRDTCRGICGHPDCELRQALVAEQAQMQADAGPTPCRVAPKKRKCRPRVVVEDSTTTTTTTTTSECSQECLCSTDSYYSSSSSKSHVCCSESSDPPTSSGTDNSSVYQLEPKMVSGVPSQSSGELLSHLSQSSSVNPKKRVTPFEERKHNAATETSQTPHCCSSSGCAIEANGSTGRPSAPARASKNSNKNDKVDGGNSPQITAISDTRINIGTDEMSATQLDPKKLAALCCHSCGEQTNDNSKIACLKPTRRVTTIDEGKNNGANDKSQALPHSGSGVIGRSGSSSSVGPAGQNRASRASRTSQNWNTHDRGNDHPDDGNVPQFRALASQSVDRRRVTISLIGNDTITVDVHDPDSELARLTSGSSVMVADGKPEQHYSQVKENPSTIMAGNVMMANQHFQQNYPQQNYVEYAASFVHPNALAAAASATGNMANNNALQVHNSMANAAAAFYGQGMGYNGAAAPSYMPQHYPTAFNGRPIAANGPAGRAFNAMPEPNVVPPNYSPILKGNANGQMVMASSNMNFPAENAHMPSNSGTYLSPSDLSAFVALRAGAGKSPSHSGNRPSVAILQDPTSMISLADREQLIKASNIRGSLYSAAPTNGSKMTIGQEYATLKENPIRNSLFDAGMNRKSVVTSNEDGVEISVLGSERITITIMDPQPPPAPEPQTEVPHPEMVDCCCQTETCGRTKCARKCKASCAKKEQTAKEDKCGGVKSADRRGDKSGGLIVNTHITNTKKRASNDCYCPNACLEDIRYMYECCAPEMPPTSCQPRYCCPKPTCCVRPACYQKPACNPCNRRYC